MCPDSFGLKRPKKVLSQGGWTVPRTAGVTAARHLLYGEYPVLGLQTSV